MPEQAALQDSLLGLEFGHYRILERIGSGGMGVVYRGYDSHLNRDVAIKLLHPGAVVDSSSRRRFLNEAHALSKLNHPNIATVFDFHTEGDRDFLVMEYIEGTTLNQKLIDGSLPEKDVVALGSQLAEGLAAAHDQSIIHRDLKPGNLRITSDGRLKILDFGLAKLRFASSSSPASETITESQIVAGTLAYMAPEQVLGAEIDARTDIHAAGAVLYQMATGTPPFAALDRLELTNEVLRSAPLPVSALNPRVSLELVRIIGKCLERDPENRYQSARELAIDLRRLQHQSGTSGSVYNPSALLSSSNAHRKVWKVSALILLFALVVLLAIRYSKRVGNSSLLPKEKQVAVLPFSANSADVETAAFGAGLTETLTAKLTQLTRDPNLQVVPAPDMHANQVATAEEARKRFGVNLVFEGSLHRVGNRIRINCILVDPGSQRQLKAQSLTVPAGDAFTAEETVVRSALDMLGMDSRLVATPENYGTQVAGAYDYYLQGIGYLQNYEREENLSSAIQVFERALSLDRNYALVYAGLGQAYWQRYLNQKQPESLQQSRSSCQKALQLDAQLPAAHSCLGNLDLGTGNYPDAAREFSFVLQNEPTNDAAYKGLADAYVRMDQLADAESTYKRAVSLRPHYWATYNWLGVFYYNQARFPEASAMFRQVVALAPDNPRGFYNLSASLTDEGKYDEAASAAQRSLAIEPSDYGYTNLGNAYFFQRRYDETIRAYEHATQLAPNDPLVWWNLGDGYYWAPGHRQDAAPVYQKCIKLASQELQLNPKDPEKLGILAICNAMLGEKDGALDALHQAFRLFPDDPNLSLRAALIYNQFGDRDETLRWLTKSHSNGLSLNRIRDYPNFDPLRSDPRFHDLLQARAKS
ncbi:MAG TPA: protein kinase [Methylomirabilota bacterium]|nr:protein kinase [Methylomirabilota bacterium]